MGCVAVSLAFFLFSAPDNNNIQETRTLELLKNKRFQVFVIPPRKPIEVITTVFFTGLSNNSIIFLISKQKPPAMLMMHKKVEHVLILITKSLKVFYHITDKSFVMDTSFSPIPQNYNYHETPQYEHTV